MSVPLKSAPTVGVIDENNVLTLNWQPLPGPDPAVGPTPPVSQYASWDIRTKAGLNPAITVNKPATPINPDETATSRLYTTTLTSSDYTMTMIAHANGLGSPTASDSTWWQTNGVGDGTTGQRAFPAILGPSSVALDNTTVLLGQQLNVTLSPTYTGADQWQVLWPDNSSTGWLPLSASVVTKSFQTPGAQFVVVQTRRDYSGSQYDPPAQLIRQLSVQIFVIDQQAPTVGGNNTGLSTTLGFGGTEGFEIIDTSAQVATPEPWEVIARGIVRDTITNELKLLIATSRFVSASSLLGTMAIDVFPIEGRPHDKELLIPVFQLITNANTTAVPVKIQTSALPDIIVGKSINDALGGTLAMTVKDSTGIPDFIWNATGLPAGVFMGSNGVISGTPLELGLFSVTFSVQDSGSPFSIDEITLQILVKTDLKVQIGANQKDAENNVLAVNGTTLGVAQILKPYSVQMVVGNVLQTSPLPGGLPPYKWSIPAGALPPGLTINTDTGLISGVPSTYNSTTDFSKVFSAVVQVTDAIGAKATATYSMTLEAAPLQFGPIDQSNIVTGQDFKLVVPVYGGKSPYNTLIFSPTSGESGYYASSALIDGQIEIVVNVPTSAPGVHSFVLQITDALTTTILKQFSYNADVPTSATRLVKAFVDHYWYNGDSSAATPIPILPSGPGNFSGLVLAPFTDNSVLNGIVVAVDDVLEQATFTGPATVFRNAVERVPLILEWAQSEVGRISRDFLLLAHDNLSPGTDVGTIGSFARPYTIGDAVNLNPRKPFFNSPATIPTSISGVSLTARVQLGSSLPLGCSLDANTGLIYGTLTGAIPATSVLEYTDTTGLIHGTVTVTWLTQAAQRDFSTINTIVDATLGTTYDPDISPLVIMVPPAGITLANPPTVFAGTLPAGLSTGLNVAGNAVIKGTPTEAGYFDIWLQVSSSTNQITYNYFRLFVDDPLPLLVLTSNLPFIGATAYSATLYGFGGVPNSSGQYTWSSPQFPGGTGAGAFTGLLLNTATGVISGTLTAPPGGGGLTDLGNITISATDSRTALTALSPAVAISLPATTTATVDLVYTGSLKITTGSPSVATPTSNPNSVPTVVGLAVTSVATAVLGSAVYTGTITGGGSNSYAGKYFTVTGFANGANNGTFLCTASTTTLLTLSNGAAVSQSATAAAGLEYGFFFQAAGGTGVGYTWAITLGTLPNGLTLNASTGEITGAWDRTAYAGSPITVQVTDSGANTATALFNVVTGVETLIVKGTGTFDIAGVLEMNTVNIGSPYLGALFVSNTVHGTVMNWQVAPTTPHPLSTPSGLVALTDLNTGSTLTSADNNGETASLVGTAGAPFSPRLVRVVVVDAAGNTGSVILELFSGTNMAITDPSPLPNATQGISYNYQMHEIGGVGPFVWIVDASTTGFIDTFHIPTTSATLTGLSISNSGLISGTPSILFTNPGLVIRVTDSLTNFALATFSLTAQPSGLNITTTGPLVATSGRAYTSAPDLAASGSANTPYTWAISPVSLNQLPTGLTLDTNTGVISGNTTLTGFSKPIIFRVTDSLGAHVDKSITVNVVAGLLLQTGIDFADSLATLSLGFIDNGTVTSINPRPNQAFLVVATGVVSQTPGALQVSTGNPGITAQVTSLDTVAQVAVITLSGAAFAAGAPGINQVSVTLNDSGVTVTQTFNWTVYDDGVLRLAPSSGTFPTQLIPG